MPIVYDDQLITVITQAVEKTLSHYGVILTTDRYNDLDDYIRNLIAIIKENGE